MSTVTDKDLDAWKRAEEAIGRPRALERVAGRLPERLGWLLRGLSALDQGDRSAIADLASQAEVGGQGEIAVILRLVLADPDTLNPTAVRKAAKKAGLGDGMTLPYLDLLRMVACRRAGKRVTKSTAMRALEKQRPLVQGLSHNLATTSDINYAWTSIRRLSMRAEQTLAAMLMLHNGHRLTPRFLAHNFGSDELDLSAERWPDLGRTGSTMDAWIRGEGDWPEDPQTDGSKETKQRALSGILSRIHQQITEGRLVGLVGPAQTACALSHQLRMMPLQKLCHTLHLKLEWLESQQVPDKLLEALLGTRRSIEEVALLGRSAAEVEAFSPRTLRAAILFTARLPDMRRSVEELESILERVDPAMLPRHTFSRFLLEAEVSQQQRDWMTANYDLVTGRRDVAVKGLVALLPDVDDPTIIVERFAVFAEGLELDRRSHHRLVDSFVTALADKSDAFAHWVPLMWMSEEGYVWPTPVTAVLARAASIDPTALDHQEQIQLLELCYAIDDLDLFNAAMKKLSRQLVRMKPPERALRHALQLLGGMLGALREFPPSDTHAFSRFVLRYPASQIIDTIAGLSGDVPVIVGLLRWWDREPTLPEDVPAPIKAMVRRALFTDILPGIEGHPLIGPVIDELVETICEEPWIPPGDHLEELLSRQRFGMSGLMDEPGPGFPGFGHMFGLDDE